jgi:polyisoprenoid-binding protein YceI
MKPRLLHAASAAALLLGLALVTGCDDPAKGKAKAVTTDAVTQTTQATTPAGDATYTFDQSNGKVEWTGSKVTGKHDGSFDAFSGTVSLVDGTPERGSVKVAIDTGSVNVLPAMLQKHLKSADFFDVDKYPTAMFVSTGVSKGGERGATHTVTGNLTLHGVTKGITFPATIQVSGDTVDVNAEFAIDRRDFGLVYPGKKDDLIRDDVVIRLALHAKRTKKA